MYLKLGEVGYYKLIAEIIIFLYKSTHFHSTEIPAMFEVMRNNCREKEICNWKRPLQRFISQSLIGFQKNLSGRFECVGNVPNRVYMGHLVNLSLYDLGHIHILSTNIFT
jgi:hypothetical protein